MNYILSFALLGLALTVAYLIMQKLNSATEGDKGNGYTLAVFLKEAGLVKTILVMGGIMGALISYHAPLILSVITTHN